MYLWLKSSALDLLKEERYLLAVQRNEMRQSIQSKVANMLAEYLFNVIHSFYDKLGVWLFANEDSFGHPI
ncbi:hypothetical protein Trydic_g22513 [Trypoxylus dichotomus]